MASGASSAAAWVTRQVPATPNSAESFAPLNSESDRRFSQCSRGPIQGVLRTVPGRPNQRQVQVAYRQLRKYSRGRGVAAHLSAIPHALPPCPLVVLWHGYCAPSCTKTVPLSGARCRVRLMPGCSEGPLRSRPALSGAGGLGLTKTDHLSQKGGSGDSTTCSRWSSSIGHRRQLPASAVWNRHVHLESGRRSGGGGT